MKRMKKLSILIIFATLGFGLSMFDVVDVQAREGLGDLLVKYLDSDDNVQAENWTAPRYRLEITEYSWENGELVVRGMKSQEEQSLKVRVFFDEDARPLKQVVETDGSYLWTARFDVDESLNRVEVFVHPNENVVVERDSLEIEK